VPAPPAFALPIAKRCGPGLRPRDIHEYACLPRLPPHEFSALPVRAKRARVLVAGTSLSSFVDLLCGLRPGQSALALLVARVRADDHDPAVATNHPALVADLLNARLDLHGVPNLVGPTSLVPVDDPPAGQVVRREFDDNPVLGQDADVVLPHLAADVGQDLVAVGELHPEHGVRERLDHSALDLDGPVFLRHILRYLTSGQWVLRRAAIPFAEIMPP